MAIPPLPIRQIKHPPPMLVEAPVGSPAGTPQWTTSKEVTDMSLNSPPRTKRPPPPRPPPPKNQTAVGNGGSGGGAGGTATYYTGHTPLTSKAVTESDRTRITDKSLTPVRTGIEHLDNPPNLPHWNAS
jgi:hypothetical protein